MFSSLQHTVSTAFISCNKWSCAVASHPIARPPQKSVGRGQTQALAYAPLFQNESEALQRTISRNRSSQQLLYDFRRGSLGLCMREKRGRVRRPFQPAPTGLSPSPETVRQIGQIAAGRRWGGQDSPIPYLRILLIGVERIDGIKCKRCQALPRAD